jgi:hypothetical protein
MGTTEPALGSAERIDGLAEHIDGFTEHIDRFPDPRFVARNHPVGSRSRNVLPALDAFADAFELFAQEVDLREQLLDVLGHLPRLAAA